MLLTRQELVCKKCGNTFEVILLCPSCYPKIALTEQVREIAQAHGLTWDDMVGRSRTWRAVNARVQVMRYLRDEHHWSYSEIGRFLKRSHATVMHFLKPV